MGQIKNIKLHIVTDIKCCTKAGHISLLRCSLISFMEDSLKYEYFLNAGKSWQPREKISNLSYYSKSLLRGKSIKSEPRYLLMATKSWQPRDKRSDLSCYSPSLLHRKINLCFKI